MRRKLKNSFYLFLNSCSQIKRINTCEEEVIIQKMSESWQTSIRGQKKYLVWPEEIKSASFYTICLSFYRLGATPSACWGGAAGWLWRSAKKSQPRFFCSLIVEYQSQEILFR